jgi:hypothetical protein
MAKNMSKWGKDKAAERVSAYKHGGSVKHSDAAQDKKLIRSEFKKMEGAEDKGEFKRGGHVKHSKVNVIHLPPHGEPPMPPPPLPAGPMGTPGGPPGVPPVPPGAAGPFAKGGKVSPMTAGAESGPGRLQKGKWYGGKD